MAFSDGGSRVKRRASSSIESIPLRRIAREVNVAMKTKRRRRINNGRTVRFILGFVVVEK